MEENTIALHIDIEQTKKSKLDIVDWDKLVFGTNFSDHMFLADWVGDEWQNCRIRPYKSIRIRPSFSALHYGQSIFEGLKAYKNPDGEVLLFRPDANAKRMRYSAKRMCMAEFPEELFLESLKTLISIDKKWVANKKGHSLYIRPFMFATDEYIGIRASSTYRFMIICSPVGSYYQGALKVKVEREYTRAAQGGTGQAKCAGNYGGSLYPAKLAQEQGFRQLIWTDANEHKYIEEAGTMNIFFMINDTLITPPVSDTILPGITRDSILQIAKHWGVPIEERPVEVDEIKSAIEDNSLQEIFGAGTAATIAQIDEINIDGQNYTPILVNKREFSNKTSAYLQDLKYGLVEDPFGWTVKVS